MDGKSLAARVREEVRGAAAELGEVRLATVLVGDDPASQVYICHKHRAAQEVGIEPVDRRLPAGTPEEEVLGVVRELNADETIDGLLVQTPLESDADEVRARIGEFMALGADVLLWDSSSPAPARQILDFLAESR